MITRMAHAWIALNQAPVKGLIIADGVEHADQVYAALRDIWARGMSFWRTANPPPRKMRFNSFDFLQIKQP